MTARSSEIESALASVQAFGAGTALTARIAGLERRLRGIARDEATKLLAADGVDEATLSAAMTVKRLLDKDHALRFLGHRRAISSVLSRNASVADRFRAAHGDRFATVGEYWATIKDVVQIVDLRDVVPAFANHADP